MASGLKSLIKIYESEVQEDIDALTIYSSEKITEKDIEGLPHPVQKYFKICGYIGQIKMSNAKIKLDNVLFKRALKGKWMNLKCYQYNSVNEPTRIVYMKHMIFGLIPFEGRDKCQKGKGNMLIKLMKVFNIIDAQGVEMDESALLTVLSETCIMPTYALQKYMSWEAIDDFNAKATLTFNDIKVSGTFTFNDLGEIISFHTKDRYYAEKDGSYKKIPWTIEVGPYHEKNGMKYPYELKAIWNFKDGDFEYFKGNILDIEYNIKK